MTEPVITSALLTGGHEGQAEMILRIRYENGVESDVVVENELGVKLMSHCKADSLDDLVGQPWHRVMEIL